MRQYLVNAIVSLWRDGPTVVTSRVRRQKRSKPLLSGVRAAIQEPSVRERDSLLGRFPDVEWRVLTPGYWTVLPDDLIEVVKVVRRQHRFGHLAGLWLRVRQVDNTHAGAVAYAVADPTEGRTC